MARRSQPPCRMRCLALAVLLASAPVAASGQSAPRSLSIELGFTHDSWTTLGDGAPVALSYTSWITGDLDATARVAWGFAARTGGRAAAGSFEAGAGLRQGIASWGAVRAQLLADLSLVQVLGAPGPAPWTSESGVRVGGGVAVETFLARDLALGFTARATHLATWSGEGGPGAALGISLGAYF